MRNFRTYKITDAAGVAAHRAVVRDTDEGTVKKPTAAGEGKVVGITAAVQANQNKSVSVQLDGPAFAEMYGSGSYGDALEVGDSSGRLRSCQAALVDVDVNPAVVTYVVGYAEKTWTQTGDIIPITIRQFAKVTPVS